MGWFTLEIIGNETKTLIFIFSKSSPKNSFKRFPLENSLNEILLSLDEDCNQEVHISEPPVVSPVQETCSLENICVNTAVPDCENESSIYTSEETLMAISSILSEEQSSVEQSLASTEKRPNAKTTPLRRSPRKSLSTEESLSRDETLPIDMPSSLVEEVRRWMR